jgi:NAD(P)-dependent dehydrogenase (short-subunit alcohol dehydrogenase family)
VKGLPDLHDRVVAVTGASAGIGWEAALAFARCGAKVAACARRADRLDALRAQVTAAGGACWTQLCDVAEEAQVRAFVDGAAAHFGRLDVMVNNAGYGVKGRAAETSPAVYEKLLRVNFLGTVHGCQAALPHLRRAGGGVIVNVSSIVGHRAIAGGGAYAASKAAQISLTEALRVELGGEGIAVVSVHPIGTATEFVEVAARESGGKQEAGIGPQQSAATVAAAIVRAVQRPRPEVYPFPPARAIVWLNALWPGLADAWVARTARQAGRL